MRRTVRWPRWTGCSTAGVPRVGRAGTETPGSGGSSPTPGTPVVSSDLVNEGGGIQVDGAGTVLLTDTVQLDPGRNPGRSRAEVEAELARTIRTTHAVWLPRGLTRDSSATVRHPRSRRHRRSDHLTGAAAAQTDPSHPDYQVCREIRAALEGTHDAAGQQWQITEMPAPATLTDAEGYVTRL